VHSVVHAALPATCAFALVAPLVSLPAAYTRLLDRAQCTGMGDSAVRPGTGFLYVTGPLTRAGMGGNVPSGDQPLTILVVALLVLYGVKL
jgi:hypothetical protein